MSTKHRRLKLPHQVWGLPMIELVWAVLFLLGVLAMMALAIYSSMANYQG